MKDTRCDAGELAKDVEKNDGIRDIYFETILRIRQKGSEKSAATPLASFQVYIAGFVEPFGHINDESCILPSSGLHVRRNTQIAINRFVDAYNRKMKAAVELFAGTGVYYVDSYDAAFNGNRLCDNVKHAYISEDTLLPINSQWQAYANAFKQAIESQRHDKVSSHIEPVNKVKRIDLERRQGIWSTYTITSVGVSSWTNTIPSTITTTTYARTFQGAGGKWITIGSSSSSWSADTSAYYAVEIPTTYVTSNVVSGVSAFTSYIVTSTSLGPTATTATSVVTVTGPGYTVTATITTGSSNGAGDGTGAGAGAGGTPNGNGNGAPHNPGPTGGSSSTTPTGNAGTGSPRNTDTNTNTGNAGSSSLSSFASGYCTLQPQKSSPAVTSPPTSSRPNSGSNPTPDTINSALCSGADPVCSTDTISVCASCASSYTCSITNRPANAAITNIYTLSSCSERPTSCTGISSYAGCPACLQTDITNLVQPTYNNRKRGADCTPVINTTPTTSAGSTYNWVCTTTCNVGGAGQAGKKTKTVYVTKTDTTTSIKVMTTAADSGSDSESDGEVVTPSRSGRGTSAVETSARTHATKTITKDGGAGKSIPASCKTNSKRRVGITPITKWVTFTSFY